MPARTPVPTDTAKSNAPAVSSIKFSNPLGIESASVELKKVNRNMQSANVSMISGRADNMYYQLNNHQYWILYALIDFLEREVSVLSTLINRSATEIIKYNINWQPKFKKKCMDCGAEYQQTMTECRECGSKRLIAPDEKQKDYFTNVDGKSFLKEANNNGQTLKAVIKSYVEMQYKYNDAGIVRVSADTLDPNDMSIESSRTLEFLAVDPKFKRMLYDGTGEPGKTFGFTADNRSVCMAINDTEFNGFTKEGKTIYPAFWTIGENHGATADCLYYTKDEIFSDHWFAQSLTYGTPIWMSILDDLYAYHYIEKHDLKRFAFGYSRGLLVLPGFDGGDIQDVADGIHATLQTNDNSIPIIGIPRQIDNNAKLDVQFVNMGNDNADSTLKIKQDIRERLQAHVGTPNLIGGDTTSSGGMNNESQQLTMYDRYLVDKYELTDEALDWVISWFPMITDWILRIQRPSKSDSEMRDRSAKIDEAVKLKNIGFAPVEWVNGEFTFPSKPVEASSPMGGGMRGGGPSFPLNEPIAPEDDVVDLDDEDEADDKFLEDNEEIDESDDIGKIGKSTSLRDIAEDMLSRGGTWGVRALMPDENYAIGDIARESYDWDLENDVSTYERSGISLGGTCATSVLESHYDYDIDDQSKLLREAIDRNSRYGNNQVIICGNFVDYGYDSREVIIGNAEVVAYVSALNKSHISKEDYSGDINLGRGWNEEYDMSNNSVEAWMNGERPDSVWREMTRDEMIEIITSTQDVPFDIFDGATADEIRRATVGTAEHHWKRIPKPEWGEGQYFYPKEWFSKFSHSKFNTRNSYYTDKCACNDHTIRKGGSKQWLKQLNDEQWFKYLEKDAYGFLRHNKDEVLTVLTAGREIADYFKTCTVEQVRLIYVGMIDVLQQGKWSVSDLRDAVQDANTYLTYEQVSRIVQTEVGRILLYAKEQSAIRNQRAGNLWEWSGPLDDRTTPMCRFLQTGDLTGEYRYGDAYDYEHLRALLPEWEDGGWTLPDLKEVVKNTYEVFHDAGVIKTPMPGDWIAHINCRHTFHERSKIADEGERIEMPDMINSFIPDPDDVLDMMSSLSGYESTAVTTVSGIDEGVAFVHGNDLQPTYYVPSDNANAVTFTFTSVNEQKVAEWAKLIIHLEETGLEDVWIAWMVQDESGMTNDEINYLYANADVLYEMGQVMGWVE